MPHWVLNIFGAIIGVAIICALVWMVYAALPRFLRRWFERHHRQKTSRER